MGNSDHTQRRLRRHYAEARHRPLNFDPLDLPSASDADWYIDHHRQVLPAERPGPPTPEGSWEIARRLLRDYRFADPAIIRHVYPPGTPAPGRTMVLEARFYGLRFYLGVRVGEVIDCTIEHDGRRARVWGWNYCTLQGHLKRGQMNQEVRKWLDTGEVEFQIHAYSQGVHIPNPVIRVGHALFGRYMQLRFYRRACRRMYALTAAALADQRRAPGKGAVR